MTTEKAETLNRFKQEVLFKALSRQDNSAIYIFLQETGKNKDKYNLLISNAENGIRKSTYKFHEDGDRCFILIDGTDYEILLPDKIPDEEPLSFHLKTPDGNTVYFEDYF